MGTLGLLRRRLTDLLTVSESVADRVVLPSSAEFKTPVREFYPPKKSSPHTNLARLSKGGTRIWFRLTMDPRSKGKLGGRPSKATLGRAAAARAVASGSQRTLNFSGAH